MTTEKELDALAERVLQFLQINDRAELNGLKLHLSCSGKTILLVAGILAGRNQASLEMQNNNIYIIKK